jgi:formate-nitrite transporter family protein
MTRDRGEAVTDRLGSADPPLKPHRSILEAEILQAEEELKRPVRGLLVSGLLAGIGIGTSLFLMAVVVSGATGALPEPVVALLVANALTVGFILVIMSRVDLFTEYTTIAILPVLTDRATLPELLRLWALVYLGNVVGAVAVAGFIAALGPALGVITPSAFGELARPMTRHGWLTTVASGLLAGWLMGVLSWLIAAARDTISQVFFIWVVTFTIGLGGLHHAITGVSEVAASLFAAQGTTLGDVGHFLLWTTLGNSAGGVLFAVLIRYSLVIRDNGDARRRDQARGRRGGREPDRPREDRR